MSDDKVLHPEYEALISDYQLMRDCFSGQRTIKEAGDKYLSPTSGMWIDGYPNTNPGLAAYTAYKERAMYHSYVKETIQSLLGTMYGKDPSFELPSSISHLIDNATPENEPLRLFMQRVNQEQLFVGRIGILVDVDTKGGNPYLSTYSAETILDWDTILEDGKKKLSYLCLDETGWVRTEKGWKLLQSFRLLRLFEGVYQTTVVDSLKTAPTDWFSPVAKGKLLTEIPFTFINTIDICTSPPQPPLIDLANMSISIYRASADYQQSLFYQAQPTLVRTGAEGMDPSDKNMAHTGAGALVDLPTGGTLSYVEVTGAGLSEMRTALDTNKAKASVFTSDFLRTGGANTSGEALKVRLEAAAATLKNIALTGAYGLENALRHALLFAGGTGLVSVEPNLDFQRDQLVASELKALVEAKNAGAPISDMQIHRYLQSVDFTDLDYDTAIEEIALEKPQVTQTPPLIPAENISGD